jgi:hypothetical protein
MFVWVSTSNFLFALLTHLKNTELNWLFRCQQGCLEAASDKHRIWCAVASRLFHVAALHFLEAKFNFFLLENFQ